MFLDLCIMMLIISVMGYFYGQQKALKYAAVSSEKSITKLNSLPKYHGSFVAFWCLVPNLVLLFLWFSCSGWIENIYLDHYIGSWLSNFDKADRLVIVDKIYRDTAVVQQNHDVVMLGRQVLDHFSHMEAYFITILSIVCLVSCFWYAQYKIQPEFRARRTVEKYIVRILLLCACVAILTTLGIVLSLFFEAWRFFQAVPLFDFLFGLKWSPQTAIHAGQASSEGSFGIVPLFSGTMLITIIAMLVAAPAGLFSAIFMSDYASPRARNILKPLLEILAGIPTVVFGFFAALVVAPLVRSAGESVGLSVASESALAAGLVMGVMIIPFVSSLSDDVMSAVPKSLRDGSYGLGATKSETIRKVVLPAALPGIIAAMLLAISRAIGETMIVVMAAGLRANLTANPLEDVTTVTVQIVALLTGDQEFNTPKTLSVFALGLVLFFVTLSMNLLALRVVRKYREKYD